MNVFETLPYLVKVNLFWILFYACYWLLFRKHTFFRWNRFYLVAALLISWTLPMIEIPAQESAATTYILPESNYTHTIPQALIPQYQQVTPSETTFDGVLLLIGIYALGLIYMVFQLGRGLNNLRSVIARSEVLRFDDYKLVLIESQANAKKQTGSFSFFKWLFLTKDDYEHHLDVILNHELVHIHQRHSFDILLIEVLKVVFWFNPILWFYKKSLQQVHEFLADEKIPDRNSYSTFLVSYALNAQVQSLTNHFFNSRLLKARIHMIYKNRTSRWLLSKYFVILPAVSMLIILTAARKSKEPVHQPVAIANEQPAMAKTKPEASLLAQESGLPRPSDIQENISVKGVIVDKEGNGIADAIVIVKNSKRGAPTDENGKFELKDVPANSILVVSHLNYVPAEMALERDKKEYKKTLEKKISSFDEVVVVGYLPLHTEAKPATKPAQNDGLEFEVVERKPEFPGGELEMYKTIARKLRYPTKAMAAKIEGRILVSFRIDQDGKASDAKIVQGLGYGLDEEAIRVIYTLPKWNPALQNGKPIAMEYTLPIMFSLEHEQTEDKRQGMLAAPEPLQSSAPLSPAPAIPAYNGDPLLVLNGEVLKERGKLALAEMAKLDDITSISLIKGSSAVRLYGNEGANGVYSIHTRNPKTANPASSYRYNTGKVIKE